MKRRLNETIEIGDEVYVSSDEYKGTVIDINGDEVLIDGPFGEEYFDINDLEKLGGDYEEDLPPSFRKNFTESRKKIIRLTESDLARIVKKVINENMDNDTALNVYRKLKQEGEIMDETYKRIRNIREELDVMVMNHVRSGTANTIFDYDQRTPNEVSENVQQLSRKINELEGILSQYKRFVKRAISL